jgi:uncharacterized protein YukE
MFLEQVIQNATTWSGTLQKNSNFKVEFEQVKKNMSETHNRLQTYSLKLETMLKTFKNLDKKQVTIKRQMNRVQHEN